VYRRVEGCSATKRGAVSVDQRRHPASHMRSPRLFLAAAIAAPSPPSRNIGCGFRLAVSFFPAVGMMRPRPASTNSQRRSAQCRRRSGRRTHTTMPRLFVSSLSTVHSPSIDGDGDGGGGSTRRSVTGPIYELDGAPRVTLYTKLDCTLCDKVKDVLQSLRDVQPHSLYAVDITDDDKRDWFSKYKYDIPVLHINGMYWTKHRLSVEDAVAGIELARMGHFTARRGEPDASRLEHN
ncbi:hypothetical protein ACHAXA_005349, partial [Cyclostephanos tholiformis]